VITRKCLEDAPMWTIFTGAAEDPGPIRWDVAAIYPEPYPEEIERKMEGLGILLEEPQREDAAEEQPSSEDDIGAALAFLRSGGALCKVPDSEDATSPNSKYWRLLVIEPLALADVFLHLIAFDETDHAIPAAPLR
jgi:hypothetical protein